LLSANIILKLIMIQFHTVPCVIRWQLFNQKEGCWFASYDESYNGASYSAGAWQG